MRLTTPDDADLPQVAVRDDVDPDYLVLVRPRIEAPRDPLMVLLQEQGLSPLAVSILRHVQNLEADDSFQGILSVESLATIVDTAYRIVRTEVKRLLEDGYLAVDHQEATFSGVLDLLGPRLTTRGVAVLATPT
jgi:hypothetical protein